MQARVAVRLALSMAVAGAAALSQAAQPYVPPTTDAFLRAIKSYPFEALPARRDRIRGGVPRLTRCMASSEVRQLIGDPDFGYITYKSGPAGRLPAMNWSYVLQKKARQEVEPGSRVVTWFDSDGKLQGVTVYGAPDIESNISRRTQACTAT